jgi:hypothetical protein
MVIKTINTMVKQWLSLILILASLGLAQAAYATAWIDFAQTANPVTILSEDANNATVILVKSGTCPKNGYLLVTGGASFHAYPDSTVFSYSLTTDTTAPFAMDFAHAGTIRPNFSFNTVGVYDIPFSIQRVDRYTLGQTISYRLVGSVSNGFVGDSAAYSSTLVIQFFDVLI